MLSRETDGSVIIAYGSRQEKQRLLRPAKLVVSRA